MTFKILLGFIVFCFSFLSLRSIYLKRYLSSFIYSLFFLINFIFGFELIQYILNLGGDSFIEVNNFNYLEFKFWIESYFAQFVFKIHDRNIFFALCGLFFFIFNEFIKKKFLHNSYHIRINNIFTIILFFIIFYSYYLLFNNVIKLAFQNINSYNNLIENFDNELKEYSYSEKMNVFVYIGESTSSMNMSIYDYYRDNTPNLDLLLNDRGFLKFNNIFSTHTHTSPSLLETLSFPVNVDQNTLSIENRDRISIIDPVNKLNIKTKLISNQGSSGSWNQASSVIFKNIEDKIFATDLNVGNRDFLINRKFDHIFLEENLSKENLNDYKLIFFHSYAGHGDYLDNIPNSFKKNIDDFYKSIHKREPYGINGISKNIDNIENYDSAIKYIDYSISKSINLIKSQKKPWVFLYFSDHGDAVFPNRGHDSAQYVIEMATIPLFIYFNDTALNQYPDLFDKYKKISKQGDVHSSANIIPISIYDFLGINVNSDLKKKVNAHSPIIVRNLGKVNSYVKIFSDINPENLINKSDSASKILSSNNKLNDLQKICYHRSNNLASALRGTMVTSCLELDIVVDGSDIFVYHPPDKSKLLLKDIFTFLKKKNPSYWLDAKNLNTPENCSIIFDFLNIHKDLFDKILLEFPSNSLNNFGELESCSFLKEIPSISLSYYLPTELLIECSKELDLNSSNKNNCNLLDESVKKIENTDLFSDLSFDYKGKTAVLEFFDTDKYNFNIWNIDFEDIGEVESIKIDYMIPNISDANIR